MIKKVGGWSHMQYMQSYFWVSLANQVWWAILHFIFTRQRRKKEWECGWTVSALHQHRPYQHTPGQSQDQATTNNGNKSLEALHKIICMYPEREWYQSYALSFGSSIIYKSFDDQRWCDGGRDQQNTVANLLDSFTIELRWGLNLLALDHFPAAVLIFKKVSRLGGVKCERLFSWGITPIMSLGPWPGSCQHPFWGNFLIINETLINLPVDKISHQN